MKLDTSTYYPKSHLDDDVDNEDWIGSVEMNGESVIPATTFVDSKTPVDGGNPVNRENNDDSQFLPDDGKPETETVNFIDKVCTLVSWLLVPLLMPVYGMLLAFNFSILNFMPFKSKLVFVAITLGFTLLIPMLLIFILKRLGMIKDVGLNGRKERFVPYIISIVSLVGTGWFMIYKGAPMWLGMFYMGGAAAGVVNLIVNFKWKISAHAAGIAGLVALMIRILSYGYPMPGSFTWLVVLILAAGLLGSVRIWQGRHTMWQVLAGYSVGFLSVLLMTLI